MPVDKPEPGGLRSGEGPATAARRLIRTALKGSLATLDRASGHPFASLVLLAAEPDGTPVFLISRLALHTQNLAVDARASLLIDGTADHDDPLTGARLTLTGLARPTGSATAKLRFVARHPSAQAYANFPDFATYAFEIAGGHFVGGFGKIVHLEPGELISNVADAAELIAAEGDIVRHMNDDHADAVALYASELGRCTPGEWHMAGIDPEGFDLLHCNNAARIEFADRVRTPSEARLALVDLVKQARAKRDAVTR